MSQVVFQCFLIFVLPFLRIFVLSQRNTQPNTEDPDQNPSHQKQSRFCQTIARCCSLSALARNEVERGESALGENEKRNDKSKTDQDATFDTMIPPESTKKKKKKKKHEHIPTVLHRLSRELQEYSDKATHLQPVY
ncbi:hypothetical protein B0J12DRAFT_280573 [Macrophomina phaseolina]|uniref:Uncharacterized protein n=1 Tax=Macrophomina phaseolina TaxID=35725 RepID=A0ABQ8GMV6_9PEZI|nr:hypothetical protein B0J12DRAFT_280573 [Macrophomina phaseolina]